MDKEDVVCVHIHTHTHTHTHTNGILLSQRRERSFIICNNTSAPGGYYAKWITLAEKEKYLIYHSYVVSKN